MSSAPRRRRKDAAFRVALAIPHAIPFLERLLIGVAQHARASAWTFVRMPERIDPSLDWLQDWDGDGVLVAAQTPRDLTVARSLAMPVVNLMSHLPDDSLPLVAMDHRAIGRMAARHLRERSFTNLAFYGVRKRFYSDERREGFCETLADEGLVPHLLEADAQSPRAWIKHQQHLERWLRDLPTPVGLFACTDERAVEVLEVCRRLGRKVPQDIAVIGVDNDPVLCEFAQPPLTSIARDDQRAGTVAGALLQRLMEARRKGLPLPIQPHPLIIAPVGVVERQSTATYAVRHPQVAALVARITERFHEQVTMEQLLAGLPLARRRMEHLFRTEMGVSPYQFILRARLARVRDLIARKDGTTLTAIAKASGFSSLRHLRLARKRSAQASTTA